MAGRWHSCRRQLQRLAQEFHPTEKLMVSEKPSPNYEEQEPDNRGGEDSENADLKDFEAALKEARVKPRDPAKATAQHKTARDSINSTSPLQEEFDSEFADYHRGALAYRNKQWDGARKEWENLLKRPEQDRHYRTVWAAFMLGKLALKTEDFPTAAQWFQRTREFVRAGFADSLGLAADSYGWEGRAEWKQDRPEKAAGCPPSRQP